MKHSKPSKVMFTSVNITALGLTNPDVNLKRMHQMYNDVTVALLHHLLKMYRAQTKIARISNPHKNLGFPIQVCKI